MKLHEEFKLYENLWEETALASASNNNLYTRVIGKQSYNLLDKAVFKDYVKKRFYMRGYAGNGRPYRSAKIFTMDSYINQLKDVLKKIVVSLETDKKKGLLDETVLAKLAEYSRDVLQEYKQLRDSSDLMIVYEKDEDFYKKYILKFCDIGDPVEAYKFIKEFGKANTVFNLLRQNNKSDTLKKLITLIKEPDLVKGISDNTNNSSTTSPDESIEYDSFFKDLK